MHDAICKRLSTIEKQEDVFILHAVESGSRAWGFASPDSDYDVRFIYVRPLEFYLQLEPTRDVLEYSSNNLLDINGWDLNKSLRLLHASNPTFFEWCNSPLIYRTTPVFSQVQALADQYFQPKSGLWHYLSMAEGNYHRYLKDEHVRLKKYFYVIRPILACRWILEHNCPPPMPFRQLVEAQLAPEIKPQVMKLLAYKISAKESKLTPHIDELNQYIEIQLASLRQQITSLPARAPVDWQPLNRLFTEIVHG